MQNMIYRLRDKISRFMTGRYGADELARFESIVLLIIMLAAVIVRQPIVNLGCFFIMLFLLIHSYVRMFSKNISKRRAENQKFLNFRYRMVAKASKMKNHIRQQKTYRFYKCPTCKQKVRVPKGHGKICITCPKCREQFVRRS